jgi:hypothetical protein
MPELVNIRVGSLPGTKGLDATTVWPLDSKKSKKVLRMSETEKVAWLMGVCSLKVQPRIISLGPVAGFGAKAKCADVVDRAKPT